MAKVRENVFTRHPNGEEILAKVLNKQLSQTQAADLLGCTSANVSAYLKSRNLRPSLAQRKSPRAPSNIDLSLEKLDELGQITLTVDGKTPLDLMGAIGWRAILQGLIQLGESEMEPEQYVKVVQALIRMFEFQFRNRIPDIPEKQITIDRETENRLIQRLGEFCEQCPFRRAFHEKKTREQSKFRLEPEQSA